jgi:hypothetical protein
MDSRHGRETFSCRAIWRVVIALFGVLIGELPAASIRFLIPITLQRCTIGRQAALFGGDWYPNEQYNPYDELR